MKTGDVIRRAILTALVMFAASQLPACTTHNYLWDMHDDLNSDAMNKRIAEARQP